MDSEGPLGVISAERWEQEKKGLTYIALCGFVATFLSVPFENQYEVLISTFGLLLVLPLVFGIFSGVELPEIPNLELRVALRRW